MLRFVLVILVVSGVGIGAVLLFAPVRPSFLYPTSLLLALLTITIYRHLLRQESRQIFVQLYLASMAIKLLVACAYVLTMAMLDKSGAFPNVLFFLCAYVVFTALEVAFLYRNISDKT